jgi:hypothetical protein
MRGEMSTLADEMNRANGSRRCAFSAKRSLAGSDY